MTDEYTAAFDALEAANSARETQVEAMSTLISAMGEMLKAKGSEFVTLPKALYDEWVAANDAALDWADANARWFDIRTAPWDGTPILAKCGDVVEMIAWFDGWESGVVTKKQEPTWGHSTGSGQRFNDEGWDTGTGCYSVPQDPTHWRPIQNPPLGQLPEPLERLGEVLRRVKGVS